VGISYADMFGQCADEALLRKVPAVRIISVPRPSEDLPPEQITDEMVPQLIDALTEPLNEEEAYSGIVTPDKPPRIAMTGTYDEVQDFFIGDMAMFEDIEPHCKWTDGLPIVPPTLEKVAAMLEGTTHDPEEEFDVINFEADVGYRPVELGLRYNVEKVAINAVMAGCRPEMMPICLAIAETHPGRFITTTASADFGVVTGPIAYQVGMASRRNALMPGNLANAALGRFMALFRLNIAKFIPDVTMQHPQGNPINKGLVFAENDEGSPWTNLSEEHGFGSDESTYTRFHSKGLWDFGVSLYGALYSDAYGEVNRYPHGDEIFEPPEGDFLHYMMNVMKASGMPKYFILLVNPEDVQRLHDKGFETKDDVRQYIWDRCTVTYAEWRNSDPWWAMPFHTYTNATMLNAQGLTREEIDDDTIIHFPLYGKESLYFVHLGSGTPIPTLIRGDHCVTVSVDKWR